MQHKRQEGQQGQGQEQRRLDDAFAIAQGIYAERLMLVEMLCRQCKAKRARSAVLRWFVEQDGAAHWVKVSPKAIAESTWVSASERTVQRAIEWWQARGVLTVRRRIADNGRVLPPHAKLCWDAVLSRLRGPRRDAVPGGPSADQPGGGLRSAEDAGPLRFDPDCERRQSTPDEGSSQRQHEPFRDPPSSGGLDDKTHCPGDKTHTAPEGLGDKTGLLHGAWLSVDRVRACARTVCGLVWFVSVVDDVRYKPNQTARRAAWDDVRELAAQAGRVLWPQWPDVQHSDWRLIHAAAVAAKVLFSDAWLLRSVEATAWQIRHGGRQVRNRASYLVGVLRSKCHVMAGVGDSPQDCSADWFASVLYPLEQCVEVFCQPVAQARQTQPPSPAQEPADWRSMSDQERADARAAIADVVKQLKPCKP